MADDSATNMWMKIDDVDGESQNEGFKGYFDVLDWGWGMSQPEGAASGGGAGLGSAKVERFTLKKNLDQASHVLAKYCAMGQHFDKVELVAQKAGGKDGPVTYLKVSLNQALIVDIKLAGAANEPVTENLEIAFKKIHIMYTSQDEKGKKKAEFPMAFDVAKKTFT